MSRGGSDSESMSPGSGEAAAAVPRTFTVGATEPVQRRRGGLRFVKRWASGSASLGRVWPWRRRQQLRSWWRGLSTATTPRGSTGSPDPTHLQRGCGEVRPSSGAAPCAGATRPAPVPLRAPIPLCACCAEERCDDGGGGLVAHKWQRGGRLPCPAVGDGSSQRRARACGIIRARTSFDVCQFGVRVARSDGRERPGGLGGHLRAC